MAKMKLVNSERGQHIRSNYFFFKVNSYNKKVRSLISEINMFESHRGGIRTYDKHYTKEGQIDFVTFETLDGVLQGSMYSIITSFPVKVLSTIASFKPGEPEDTDEYFGLVNIINKRRKGFTRFL